MGGPKKPIAVIMANGKSHMTKAAIEERMQTEVLPCTDEIEAPSYLTAAEKKRFYTLAKQLKKLEILGETDTETLARYVTAQMQYEKVTKSLRKILKQEPEKGDDEEYYTKMDLWAGTQERLANLQNKYFRQAQAAAGSMGLTISSRCKLVAPVKAEEPKINKFSAFGEADDDE